MGGYEGEDAKAGEVVWGTRTLLDSSVTFGHLFSSILDWGTRGFGSGLIGMVRLRMLRCLHVGLCRPSQVWVQSEPPQNKNHKTAF